MSMEIKNLKTYLNFPSTTQTFKNLIYKYHKRKKGTQKLNKKLLLKNIEKKIQELENDEKENDFIISEVRRNAQINKEILYSFGTKALNHLDQVRKLNVTTKIDKSKFFEPDNESTNSNNINININEYKKIKSNSLNTRYSHNRHKIINLPIINKSRNFKNLENSIILNKISDYSMENKYESRNKNNDILNLMSPTKKENTQNLSLFYIKSPLTTERETNELNNKENISTFRKRRVVIDNDYFDYIQKMKTKFLKTEKKQERYFNYNKYGYDDFKLKYNYLKKKYFS